MLLLPRLSVSIVLPTGSHFHEHAVVSGSSTLRYSSTHRVAATGGNTFSHVQKRCEEVLSGGGETAESGRILDLVQVLLMLMMQYCLWYILSVLTNPLNHLQLIFCIDCYLEQFLIANRFLRRAVASGKGVCHAYARGHHYCPHVIKACKRTEACIFRCIYAVNMLRELSLNWFCICTFWHTLVSCSGSPLWHRYSRVPSSVFCFLSTSPCLQSSWSLDS